MATDKTSHALVLKEDVQLALTKEKGSGAALKDFKILNFTKEGDNYTCVVTSVEVEFEKDGEKSKTSYIVKLNNGKSDFDATVFKKEVEFYSELVPRLNSELSRAGSEPLRVPKYFHSVVTPGKEAMYLSDLRTDEKCEYKMLPREKGMDKKHTELVLKELARLHAASVKLLSSDNTVEGSSCLKEASKVGSILPKFMARGAENAKKSEGYEVAAKYLEKNSEGSVNIFKDQLKSEEPFKVICHGDCWSNNFLFSYSEDGETVQDCRLLDFQVTRVGSPALDLNVILYSCLTGETRKKEIDGLLSSYYDTFANVLAAAGTPSKFTLPELEQEFKRKNPYGLLMGLVLIYTALKYHGVDEEIMTESDDKLTERYLALFDDMLESGVIC